MAPLPMFTVHRLVDIKGSYSYSCWSQKRGWSSLFHTILKTYLSPQTYIGHACLPCMPWHVSLYGGFLKSVRLWNSWDLSPLWIPQIPVLGETTLPLELRRRLVSNTINLHCLSFWSQFAGFWIVLHNCECARGRTCAGDIKNVAPADEVVVTLELSYLRSITPLLGEDDVHAETADFFILFADEGSVCKSDNAFVILRRMLRWYLLNCTRGISFN
jgi:hypothetical protein